MLDKKLNTKLHDVNKINSILNYPMLDKNSIFHISAKYWTFQLINHVESDIFQFYKIPNKVFFSLINWWIMFIFLEANFNFSFKAFFWGFDFKNRVDIRVERKKLWEGTFKNHETSFSFLCGLCFQKKSLQREINEKNLLIRK